MANSNSFVSRNFTTVEKKGATNMKNYTFQVCYANPEKNDIASKTFTDIDEATKAYQKIQTVKPDYPRKLEYISNCGPVLVTGFGWQQSAAKALNAYLFKQEAERCLREAGLNKARIGLIMSLPVEELVSAVATRSVAKLMEIPGIGEKTAKAALFALKPLCKPQKKAEERMRTFTRLQLDNEDLNNIVKVDTIKKSTSEIERYALSFGNDALIYVVAEIRLPLRDDDIEVNNHIAALEEWINRAAHYGIPYNGNIYVPAGHTPNASKECKTFWIKKELYDQIREYAMQNVSSDWKTTTAKEIAYMWGLKATPYTSWKIPFKPEDFAIMDSVVDVIHANVTKLFLDGHEENLDNYNVEINRSDGIEFLHITPEMKAVLYNRMLERGDDPDEADRILENLCNDHSPVSTRADKMANKGLCVRNVDFHQVLADNGVTRLPDGRDLKYIVGLLDETTVKTSIGPKGAYKSFAELCNAVGDTFDMGTCVKAHKLSRKNVSYQVLQCLCETSDDVLAKIAAPTIERIDKMHTVEGAAKALGPEMGSILRKYPSFANVPLVKEMIELALAKSIDEAFGGKILKACEYSFGSPDPFYILFRWFGIDKDGMLAKGQILNAKTGSGEKAMWRSPTVHPNSIRVVKNVKVPAEFRKYFLSGEFMTFVNCCDDLAVAMDADWDGDHFFTSEFEALIEAAKQTLAKWDRLIVWETPSPEKKSITRKDELEYFANLTKRNELGKTVIGLNNMLNCVLRQKNKKTGEVTKVIIPVNHHGVNFKKFAANVLVDANKHGSARIKEPYESSQAKWMDAPWAKDYRDETLKPLPVDEHKRPLAGSVEKKRATLDSMVKNIDEKFAVGTLNRYFALLAKSVDRSLVLRDAPEEEFDFRVLMYNAEESRRGLSGLWRKGALGRVYVDGEWIVPDEGLFNSLSRRLYRQFKEWNFDSSRKDTEDKSFFDLWRENALNEIEAFAESMGRTLEDAYDVVTWQLFKYADSEFKTMDGSMNYILQNLRRGWRVIFGGMAQLAVLRDVDSMSDDDPVSINPDDDFSAFENFDYQEESDELDWLEEEFE